ncbi:hypothetical protein D9758_010949 [Tetrapyrgos nigripes]|uniref:Uncharacterized protein n=1 Tax=Tetrapyrgos nigripes TaxID=182062 RepID=A0A8H5FTR7_9AGAR|nr:hypothetical protein D9758_010949 [Tetrapyrgos nigripes]
MIYRLEIVRYHALIGKVHLTIFLLSTPHHSITRLNNDYYLNGPSPPLYSPPKCHDRRQLQTYGAVTYVTLLVLSSFGFLRDSYYSLQFPLISSLDASSILVLLSSFASLAASGST